MADTVRDLLRKADNEKAIAHWADSLQVTIRLHRPIKAEPGRVAQMLQRGPFKCKRHDYLYELDDRMPPDAVDALYRALFIVRCEAEEKAAALEGQVVNRPEAVSDRD